MGSSSAPHRAALPRTLPRGPAGHAHRASYAAPARDLSPLPTAHLHVHVESTVRPATARALGDDRGVSLPGIDAWPAGPA